MTQETIQINNKRYGIHNIDELRLDIASKNNWIAPICEFLRCWFGSSDYIALNSSGSTGLPKELRLPKSSMRNSARITNQFFGLCSTTTALLCLPASYIAGKMMLVRAIVGDYNIMVVEPKANPFENINCKIDFTAITPYQLNHSIASLQNLDVQKIIVGGSAVSDKLKNNTKELSAAIFESYGMTETASHIALRPINGANKSAYFSVLNGITIRKDNRNCLLINAPHLFPDEITTNDIVEIKDENSFLWLGRYDSVINSGGIKIHPEQVERKLENIIHEQFFISSIPDNELGNKLILIIESDISDKNEKDKLIQTMKKALNKYEVPTLIYYAKSFVYSQSNKVLQNETKKIALSNLD